MSAQLALRHIFMREALADTQGYVPVEWFDARAACAPPEWLVPFVALLDELPIAHARSDALSAAAAPARKKPAAAAASSFAWLEPRREHVAAAVFVAALASLPRGVATRLVALLVGDGATIADVLRKPPRPPRVCATRAAYMLLGALSARLAFAGYCTPADMDTLARAARTSGATPECPRYGTLVRVADCAPEQLLRIARAHALLVLGAGHVAAWAELALVDVRTARCAHAYLNELFDDLRVRPVALPLDATRRAVIARHSGCHVSGMRASACVACAELLIGHVDGTLRSARSSDLVFRHAVKLPLDGHGALDAPRCRACMRRRTVDAPRIVDLRSGAAIVCGAWVAVCETCGALVEVSLGATHLWLAQTRGFRCGDCETARANRELVDLDRVARLLYARHDAAAAATKLRAPSTLAFTTNVFRDALVSRASIGQPRSGACSVCNSVAQYTRTGDARIYCWCAATQSDRVDHALVQRCACLARLDRSTTCICGVSAVLLCVRHATHARFVLHVATKTRDISDEDAVRIEKLCVHVVDEDARARETFRALGGKTAMFESLLLDKLHAMRTRGAWVDVVDDLLASESFSTDAMRRLINAEVRRGASGVAVRARVVEAIGCALAARRLADICSYDGNARVYRFLRAVWNRDEAPCGFRGEVSPFVRNIAAAVARYIDPERERLVEGLRKKR